MIEGYPVVKEGRAFKQMSKFAFDLLTVLRNKKRDGIRGRLQDALCELKELGYVDENAEITNDGILVAADKKFLVAPKRS